MPEINKQYGYKILEKCLIIDGQKINVPQGTTVLEAAEKLGIFIPHYCYHPSLSTVGSCRMCYVEIEGIPKLQTSCSTVARDGMVVHTNSEKVKQARESNMEFLLINHPLDCPECDQAGECMLQDYSFDYGKQHSRFHEIKRNNPNKDLGPHIVLFTNRCILCTRCVRFCREISGYEELGVFNRGNNSQIDIYQGQPLKHPMAGNIVDICPVGAMIDKDFLHKSRAWNLVSTSSICPKCSAGCNIHLGVMNNRIYRVKPRFNPEVNDYWICDYGRYGYHEWDTVERIMQPLKKTTDGFIPISWKEALTTISDQFQKIINTYGNEAVGGIGSANASNEENFLLYHLIHSVIGSSQIGLYHIETDGYNEKFKNGFTIEADKNPNGRGARDMLNLKNSEGSISEFSEKLKKKKLHGIYFLHQDLRNGLSDEETAELRKSEFLVVQDVTLGPAARLADIVLPGTNYAETEGTFTNSSGLVQYFDHALEPPGLAEEGWAVIQKVIKRFGQELNYQSAEDVFAEITRLRKQYSGISYTELKKKPKAVHAA